MRRFAVGLIAALSARHREHRIRIRPGKDVLEVSLPGTGGQQGRAQIVGWQGAALDILRVQEVYA